MRQNEAGIGSALRAVRPVPQSLSNLVRVTRPQSPVDIPAIVESVNKDDLRLWAEANRELIQKLLAECGAVLLRGFRIDSPADFGTAVDAALGTRIQYTNRSSPRTSVGDRVYTSTDYPNYLPIFPHNEHGYSPIFPLYLAFGCMQPAESGGATPIGSTRKVGASVPAWIQERFRKKGILYLRNYHEGIGLPWQKSFQTTEREEVERYCAERGIQCEWRSDGDLRTRRIGPAEIAHPLTGEKIWFNHATFYHVSTLPELMRQEVLAGFAEDELPNQTYYGDGSSIEPEVLDELRAAYTKPLYRFDWRRGDVLLLDNMLAVHARDPFSGPRRVLVSMVQEVRVA
jgi:alpha-ketoglutarate-dependent taurine dioxygenase